MDEESFDLVDFLASDSESDSDFEFDDEIPTSRNICSEKTHEIVQMQIKNRLSHKATSRVANLINSMPNMSIKIPSNPIKNVHSDINFDIIFNCENCDEIIANGFDCEQCGQNFNKNSKKNNFLVHISLERQIRRLLNLYFHEIVNYFNRERAEGVLTDVDDGTLFQEMCRKNSKSMILGLTINADGANIYNSSRGSLWPVQLYANFLPPNIRYNSENVIVTTLYYGEKKPNMTTLLYPLAAELDSLRENPILIYKNNEIWHFVVSAFLGVFDLPARADVQGMVGPVGKYGCPFCHHPGVPIKNLSGKTTIRYIHTSTPHKLRNHSETIKFSQRILAKDFQRGEKKSLNGIKGNSALLLFDDIDIILSLPIDIMHGTYLGIMKNLIEIWIGRKKIPTPPYKHYKIKSVEHRQLLSKRIMSLKPTMNFCRKPRSIFEVGNFKASELMNYMFYYLRYCLVGILPTKVVKNFEKLSAAMYVLCQRKITTSEVKLASEMLVEFLTEFEEIYGPGAVTMNIHVLTHFHDMVLRCGPPGCYNMFGFESKIGKLKQLVCGPTDVLSQIAAKYVMELNDQRTETEEMRALPFSLYQPSKIDLKSDHMHIFESYGINESTLKIWRRSRINGVVYTSNSAAVTKSVDYFVRLKDRKIGKIIFFFEHQQKPKLFFHVYEEIHQNFHWIEVNATSCYEIRDCDDIYEKLLYFIAGRIEYITKELNVYGRCKYMKNQK